MVALILPPLVVAAVMVPPSVVPPTLVTYGLSVGLPTDRLAVPTSPAASYAPASPAARNVLWPCAASSRNASSKACAYAGVPPPAAAEASSSVSDSLQLD